MHFSKTYTQLLLNLPPELRENAIEYRQLKKIINSVVNELSALGLKPDILHELIEASDTPSTSSHDKEGNTTSASQSPPEPLDTSNATATTSASEAGTQADAEVGNTQPSTDANANAPAPAPGEHAHGHAPENEEDVPKPTHPKVVYELNATSGKIEPQLRIWISMPMDGVPFPLDKLAVFGNKNDDGVLTPEDGEEEEGGEVGHEGEGDGGGRASSHASLLWAFQQRHFGVQEGGIGKIEEVDGLVENVQNIDLSTQDAQAHPSSSTNPNAQIETQPQTLHPRPRPLMREVVVPLVHDTEFYNLLSTKLESISEHLREMYEDFAKSLKELSRTIADSSHPASMSANFHPLSGITEHAGAVRVKTGDLKSDLYFWREIFQLYVEAEVFEGIGEASRGERTVEESERRLQLFAERVTKQGLGDLTKFKLKQSRVALEQFLTLNLFILNVKKFSFANSEATRKILKKHTKRTALTHPDLYLSPSDSHLQPHSNAHHPTHPHSKNTLTQPLLVLVPNSTPFSFPRILVQAIGETLLPIIPSVDDYSCLICTSIAFKPIRLSCGHLFCVRCLVKMQKRRNDHCPMCRSPSVLVANRTNVDWALLNFMQDWFPVEARDKLKANEKEAAEEEMRELGLDPHAKCVIM